jgi:ammonium transporter, Amt family
VLSRRRTKIAVGVGIATATVVAMASPVSAQELTVEVVQANLDNIFIMLCAVLVFFMQAGFAFLTAGLTRGKNVANIMMKNLMDMSVAIIAFAAVGFAFAYGDSVGGLIGGDGWFLGTGGDGNLTPAIDFFFQVAFAATAATIVAGAMAERMKFKAYAIYTVFLTALVYPIVVHWTWGGGWLSEIGYTDFAGSGIVHMTGGVAAAVGAAIIGPRIGKYGKDGKPRAIPGHSVPFAIIGCFILFVGWFGFNPGSVLAADGPAVGIVALSTAMAGGAGAIVAAGFTWIKGGKPDVAMAGNGLLAGLVAITAGPDVITNFGAAGVGAIGGFIVVLAVAFFDRVGIDDPVGAASVHGVVGAWGVLAVGLFAVDDGLLVGGGFDLLWSQIIGIVAITGFVGISMGIIFLGIKATVGLRVPEQEEIEGLDVHEHGYPGYSDDVNFGAPSSGGGAIGTTAASSPVHA